MQKFQLKISLWGVKVTIGEEQFRFVLHRSFPKASADQVEHIMQALRELRAATEGTGL